MHCTLNKHYCFVVNHFPAFNTPLLTVEKVKTNLLLNVYKVRRLSKRLARRIEVTRIVFVA